MRNVKRKSVVVFSMLSVLGLGCLPASAELVAMHDTELSATTGEGLGFALQDFILDSEGAELKVTGIKDSNGGEIDIDWTSFYIMGEGSEKGSVEKTADIGSYLNPWVVRSVRGSRGLSAGDADYNERYKSIGNDVALLEIATDSYDNPVQQSAVFGDFSRYQGCVYGAAGCVDLGFDGSGNSFAEREIQGEIDQLSDRQAAILNRYSSFTNSLSDLESRLDDVYQTFIVPEEQTVAAEQQDVEDAVVLADVEFGQLDPDEIERQNIVFLKIPEDCSRNLFGAYSCPTNQQEEYARSVDVVNEEKGDVREAKKALFIEMSTERSIAYGQSYLTLLSDLDEQKRLCGYDDSLIACSNGLIARKSSTRDDIETIALSLSNGQARRSGLDIGLTFEFQLNLEGGGTRDDFLDIDMRGVFVDGTSFKLWSRPSTDVNNPGSELLGELRLNLFAKELDIRACDDTICNTEALREANTLNMDNFILSLNLGYGDVQPVKFSATSEGHFQLKLENPDYTSPYANPDGLSAKAFYEDYYENAPKSYLHIGDVRVGNTSIGSSTISGARAQYLSVTTRDL